MWWRRIAFVCGWLILLAIVVMCKPDTHGGVRFLLLLPLVCMGYEAIVGRTDGLLTRVTLAMVLCWMLLATRSEFCVGRVVVPWSALLFAAMCFSFLARGSLAWSTPEPILRTFVVLVAVLVVPLMASTSLTWRWYGVEWRTVRDLILAGIQVGVAGLVLARMLESRPAQWMALTMIGAKCAFWM